MDKLDIILWAMGGGFTLVFGLMLAMWNSINKQYSDLTNRFESRMDKFDEKLTDIDRRLCRMEGAFSAKDGWVHSESSRYKQAEGQ